MKVEVENFKEVNVKSLKYKFTLFFPEWELRINDCCWLDNGKSRWLAFPQRAYKTPDGGTRYFSYISFSEVFKKEIEGQVAIRIAMQGPPAETKPSQPSQATQEEIPF